MLIYSRYWLDSANSNSLEAGINTLVPEMLQNRSLFLILLGLHFSPITPAIGETFRVTPDGDWFGKLHGSGLKPGDELVLAPGIYSSTRRLELGHRGTRDKPIIIRGEKGAIIKRPDARQNTINMAGCQYLRLQPKNCYLIFSERKRKKLGLLI